MYYETALSLLIKNLYKVGNVSQCSQYYHTMIELINLGCDFDFNVPVYEDGKYSDYGFSLWFMIIIH